MKIKQQRDKQQLQTAPPTETGKGQIKHNALAALVTSKVYRSQVVKARKGKGSYQRKNRNQGREPFLIAA